MSEPMSPSAAVDKFLAETQAAVASYVDLDEIERAIGACLTAVRLQAEALAGVNYRAKAWQGKCQCEPGCTHRVRVKVPWKPDELARAMAHSAKVLDEVTRLAAFAKGQPDSRPDLGGANRDLLALLTPEQFRTVEGWLVAAQGRL